VWIVVLITKSAKCGVSSIPFFSCLEQDASESLIIAATNNQRILEKALFRRFDDVLHYFMPSADEVRRLFHVKLGGFHRIFHLQKLW